MAMREARLEVSGEPVAEGEAGVLRGRADVRVLRVKRNETARATASRRPWSRGRGPRARVGGRGDHRGSSRSATAGWMDE